MKVNSIIDIIAPSSAPKNQKWKKGIQILKTWGFQTRFDQRALSPWLFHSHKDKHRSHFLNKAFSNRDSSIVWMLRGGYGLQKLMPAFTKKKARNKLFVGYSDGTILHTYLNSQNIKTLHAPNVSELSALPQNYLKLLKSILLGQNKEIRFQNLVSLNSLTQKKIKGKITGGNLSLLSSSVGTPWFPSFKKDSLLFIEDVNEEGYKVDRMLHHLFYSGALKNVKAILFGNFNPLHQSDLKTLLKNFTDISSIPCIMALPCGHQQPSKPLPFHQPAELLIDKNKAVLKVCCA